MIDAMPEPAPPRRRVGRRTVVLGGLGALALGGCGIRLESDAPQLPFLATRTPIPAESELLAVTAQCATLAAAARTAGTSALLDALATIHNRQHDVLVTALRARSVPDELMAPPSPSGSPTASPSPTESAAAAALASAETADLLRSTALAEVDEALRPTMCALLAQRYAAATVLGGPAPAEPAAAAPVQWPVPSEIVPALEATRSARYGFEIVAAQSSGAARTLALSTIGALTGLAQAQAASLGSAVPAPALGYPLPFPVGTQAEARRLAVHLVTGLRAAYGDTLGAVTRSAADLAFGHLPWWLGRAEVLAHQWGASLEPFPGLA